MTHHVYREDSTSKGDFIVEILIKYIIHIMCTISIRAHVFIINYILILLLSTICVINYMHLYVIKHNITMPDKD